MMAESPRRTSLPWWLAAISILLITSVLLGCGAQATEVVSADQCLNEFLDEVFEQSVADSPQWESALGRKTERQGQWNDASDAHAAWRIKRVRRNLERLRQEFDRDDLGTDAQLSYDLFVFAAERQIENYTFRDHAYVLDQFNGQLAGLLTVLQNHHPIDNESDAVAYISRIEGLEAVLTDMANRLRSRADLGVVAPAFSFADVIADASAMRSGAPIDDGANGAETDNPLWTDFQDKLASLEVSSVRKQELLAAAEAALRGPYARGFDQLLGELKRLAPQARESHGVWSLPKGEAYYQNRIKHHTSLDLTADSVHALGLEEVARIHESMRELQQQVGVPGDLANFFDYVRNDPANFYDASDTGRQLFLEQAQEQIDAIYAVVGDWFNRLPAAELEVRRVEPWRENSVSIAFYNSPSQDGTRPGIYYANLADMKELQKYVFTAITYHESVPGHHFQIALAQEMEGLPKFRRFGGGHGAYVEGWALYAEQLAKEMGFYQNPLHDFGRLQNELWRAARLVIDTGIHAKHWTREQAIDYFRTNTPLSDGDTVTEVERFFVNPGQALSYKIGMLKILELRQRARKTQGENFDIRLFHDAILGAGALPLPLLEERVDRYLTGENT